MAKIKILDKFDEVGGSAVVGTCGYIDDVQFAAVRIWRKRRDLTFDDAYELAKQIHEEGKLWTVL